MREQKSIVRKKLAVIMARNGDPGFNPADIGIDDIFRDGFFKSSVEDIQADLLYFFETLFDACVIDKQFFECSDQQKLALSEIALLISGGLTDEQISQALLSPEVNALEMVLKSIHALSGGSFGFKKRCSEKYQPFFVKCFAATFEYANKRGDFCSVSLSLLIDGVNDLLVFTLKNPQSALVSRVTEFLNNALLYVAGKIDDPMIDDHLLSKIVRSIILFPEDRTCILSHMLQNKEGGLRFIKTITGQLTEYQTSSDFSKENFLTFVDQLFLAFQSNHESMSDYVQAMLQRLLDVKTSIKKYQYVILEKCLKFCVDNHIDHPLSLDMAANYLRLVETSRYAFSLSENVILKSLPHLLGRVPYSAENEVQVKEVRNLFHRIAPFYDATITVLEFAKTQPYDVLMETLNPRTLLSRILTRELVNSITYECIERFVLSHDDSQTLDQRMLPFLFRYIVEFESSESDVLKNEKIIFTFLDLLHKLHVNKLNPKFIKQILSLEPRVNRYLEKYIDTLFEKYGSKECEKLMHPDTLLGQLVVGPAREYLTAKIREIKMAQLLNSPDAMTPEQSPYIGLLLGMARKSSILSIEQRVSRLKAHYEDIEQDQLAASLGAPYQFAKFRNVSDFYGLFNTFLIAVRDYPDSERAENVFDLMQTIFAKLSSKQLASLMLKTAVHPLNSPINAMSLLAVMVDNISDFSKKNQQLVAFTFYEVLRYMETNDWSKEDREKILSLKAKARPFWKAYLARSGFVLADNPNSLLHEMTHRHTNPILGSILEFFDIPTQSVVDAQPQPQPQPVVIQGVLVSDDNLQKDEASFIKDDPEPVEGVVVNPPEFEKKAIDDKSEDKLGNALEGPHENAVRLLETPDFLPTRQLTLDEQIRNRLEDAIDAKRQAATYHKITPAFFKNNVQIACDHMKLIMRVIHQGGTDITAMLSEESKLKLQKAVSKTDADLYQQFSQLMPELFAKILVDDAMSALLMPSEIDSLSKAYKSLLYEYLRTNNELARKFYKLTFTEDGKPKDTAASRATFKRRHEIGREVSISRGDCGHMWEHCKELKEEERQTAKKEESTVTMASPAPAQVTARLFARSGQSQLSADRKDAISRLERIKTSDAHLKQQELREIDRLIVGLRNGVKSGADALPLIDRLEIAGLKRRAENLRRQESAHVVTQHEAETVSNPPRERVRALAS